MLRPVKNLLSITDFYNEGENKMNNELKDKILSKIAAESPDEWEFIINKLSKDCI